MSGDIRNEIHRFHKMWDLNRAKFWFWPIVTMGTIFLGLFDGIKGAFVGFLYGVAVGLFLIHESLPSKNR